MRKAREAVGHEHTMAFERRITDMVKMAELLDENLSRTTLRAFSNPSRQESTAEMDFHYTNLSTNGSIDRLDLDAM